VILEKYLTDGKIDTKVERYEIFRKKRLGLFYDFPGVTRPPVYRQP